MHEISKKLRSEFRNSFPHIIIKQVTYNRKYNEIYMFFCAYNRNFGDIERVFVGEFARNHGIKRITIN